MSSMPRCDAASISTTSSDVPFAIATHAWHVLSGFGVGPFTQLRPLARIRASDVFPVPRGPAKRYACRTCPAAIAFLSVRTTGSWPTTSSKSWGRYLRYSAVTVPPVAKEKGKGLETRLWLGDVDGELAPVGEAGATDGLPRFSPDGTQLAYASDLGH